jgi:hypothetical protein
MHANFTEPARRAMLIALEEAERLGQDYIGTEHLLIGLVTETQGVAAAILRRLGIDERRVRAEFAKVLVPGVPGGRAADRLPQTPRTKKAIEYAIEEARVFNHTCLGTGHLLLGLLREREGVAGQLLSAFVARLDEVRQAVCSSLRDGPEGVLEDPAQVNGLGASVTEARVPETVSQYDRFTGQARRAMLLAHREAHRFSDDYVGTEHILLGVLQEGSGRVSALLTALGASAEVVRAEVEKRIHQGPEVTVGARLPLTPPARRALRVAGEEATRLRHDRVGPEHLLLGVLHEEEAEASQVLLCMGLDLGRLSDEILKLPPPEDRNTMVQPARAPAAGRAPDPSPWELEWMLSADVRPASLASSAGPDPLAGPLLPAPSAEGLALQLRITQLVLGALAGGLAGALIRGRTGAILGVLAGLIVAAVRSTALGVTAGLAAGILVAARQAPRSPGLQLLAVLTGAVVGGCFGNFLSGFARERPPGERGRPRGGPPTEDRVDEHVRRQ